MDPFRCEDTVGGNPDANALICAGDTGATEHRKGVRAHTTDDITRCTIGVGGIHVDAIARSGRDVLDRQSCHDRTAPGIARMTGGFIRRVVVACMNVMQRTRQLEQTPGLIDPQLTNDFWNGIAAVAAQGV